MEEGAREVVEMEWSVNIICKVNKVAKSTKLQSQQNKNQIK
jgi:hypothetical protein